MMRDRSDALVEESEVSSSGFQEVSGMRKSRHSRIRVTVERVRFMVCRAEWWWPRK